MRRRLPISRHDRDAAAAPLRPVQRSWFLTLVYAGVLLGSLALATPALGQEEAEANGAEVPEEPPPDRPVPDYDGRPPPGATVGEGLLWVPRVVFAPLYLLSEFVIRRPLGAFVTWAEREELPTLLLDFFTFGPDRKAGIVPTGLIDFGFRPSVGFYAWGDDFLTEGNDLRVRGATWGLDWLVGSITNRYELQEDRSWLALNLFGRRRTDYLFYGLGPRSRDEDESRYQMTELGVELLFESDPWRSSNVVTAARVKEVEFENEACCGEPTIGQQIDQGIYDGLPPGFGQGYFAYETEIELALDTRRDWPAPGDGVRVEVTGTHGVDLENPVDRRWVRWGGTLGAYWDPSGLNRILHVALTVRFADELGTERVPFTEQVHLGGTELMRGFVEGRLIGESAAVATFEYRWPLWVWLDGTAHVAMGNVFGEHLDGFDPELLRMSFGIGFRASNSREQSFDLLIGAGTEPIDEGLDVESFRFLFGTTRGF